jgi:NitT/TauT family transport system substrate-binding protein
MIERAGAGRPHRGSSLLAVLVALVAVPACASSASRARGSADLLRVGFSPTLTQAPAQVALGTGILRRELAPVRVEATAFGSGKDAAIALSAGAIDAMYVGPTPIAALRAQSVDVAIVSGVTAGGASLIVRRGEGIDGPADLHGRKIAVPGVGNTQDIALRTWMQRHGLVPLENGGDVSIAEVDIRKLLPLMRAGAVDAAWVPEPYPTYLVAKGVAEVLIDEATLWPPGELLTANLAVSGVYMDAHPEVVRRLVAANVEAIRFIQAQPDRAEQLARGALIAAGAPALDGRVLNVAWGKLTFTWDPLERSMVRVADDAYSVGVLEERPTDIAGLYRLDDLDAVLKDEGLPPTEPTRVTT